ncbi:MAG TPA: hypothetical protein VFX21_06970, partial [Acidimicrobiia bacterium]|nr:hypothetical protein [Acidimicrobiia bacterium]
TFLDKVIPTCTATQAVTWNGTSFSCIALSAGSTPGGADKQVQFNDAGTFGTDAAITWTKNTDQLSIDTTAPPAVGADRTLYRANHNFNYNNDGVVIGYLSTMALAQIVSGAPTANVTGFRAEGFFTNSSTSSPAIGSHVGGFVSAQTSLSVTGVSAAHPIYAYDDISIMRQQAGSPPQPGQSAISFFSRPQIQATGTANLQYFATIGLNSQYTYSVDPGASITVPRRVGVWFSPATKVGSGTLNLGEEAAVFVGANSFLGTSAYSLHSLNSSVMIDNAGPMFIREKVSFEDQNVSTSGATPTGGTIDPALEFWAGGAPNSPTAIGIDAPFSFDFLSSALLYVHSNTTRTGSLGEFLFAKWDGLHDYDTGATFFGADYYFFYGIPTFKIDETRTIPGSGGIVYKPTFRPTGAGTVMTLDSASLPYTADIFAGSVFSSSGGGTYGAGSYRVGLRLQPEVKTGVTMGGTYTSAEILGKYAGTGTLGLHVGLYVAGLVSTSIPRGIWNASTTMLECASTDVASTTKVFDPRSTCIEFSPTAGCCAVPPCDCTQTATPTINDGVVGQILILRSKDVSGRTVTLQDQGTLAGTNIEMSTGTFVMGNGDTLVLQWSDAMANWYEVARSNN